MCPFGVRVGVQKNEMIMRENVHNEPMCPGLLDKDKADRLEAGECEVGNG